MILYIDYADSILYTPIKLDDDDEEEEKNSSPYCSTDVVDPIDPSKISEKAKATMAQERARQCPL